MRLSNSDFQVPGLENGAVPQACHSGARAGLVCYTNFAVELLSSLWFTQTSGVDIWFRRQVFTSSINAGDKLLWGLGRSMAESLPTSKAVVGAVSVLQLRVPRTSGGRGRMPGTSWVWRVGCRQFLGMVLKRKLWLWSVGGATGNFQLVALGGCA